MTSRAVLPLDHSNPRIRISGIDSQTKNTHRIPRVVREDFIIPSSSRQTRLFFIVRIDGVVTAEHQPLLPIPGL